MAKFIDEAGKRYGELFVAQYVNGGKPTGAVWECKCDCGGIRYVTGRELRHGSVLNCGKEHHKKRKRKDIINEVGNKYGNLTVIEIDTVKTDADIGISITLRYWNVVDLQM